MRAQFHHGNCASWGWFGVFLVAVERPMSGFEVVTMVRRHAKKGHSAMLAQLASRTSAITKFDAGVVSIRS